MRLWNHYHTPETVDEAVALLARYDGQGRVVAGGTDLLVEMRAKGADGTAQAVHPHEALIDVTRIPELCAIREEGAQIVIGAGATHTQIVESALLAKHATCLVEGCGVIGGPQVRNVGTLGGNVAHALPAGDGTTALVALDAEAEIVQAGTRRRVPILDMFVGTGKSLIDPARDLVVAFRVPRAGSQEASAFKRVMRPQGVALPVLGCAVWLRLDAGGNRFESVRVSIAPAGPTPGRVGAVESALDGQPVDQAAIDAAIRRAQETLRLRTSKYRATAAYRHEMVAVLLRHALGLAVRRAQTGQAIPDNAEL